MNLFDPAKAAQMNSRDQSPSSIYKLACRYYNGDGVRRDWKKAHNLTMIAASLGYTPAISALGSHYDYGIGVQRNPRLAFSYYVAAAKAGDPGALVSEGACYAPGVGVERDWKLPFRCFGQPPRHIVPQPIHYLGNSHRFA